MADPLSSLTGNITSQISSAVAVALSTQMQTLIPEIMQTLRTASANGSDAIMGMPPAGITTVVTPSPLNMIERAMDANQENGEPRALSFKQVLMPDRHKNDDSSRMQAQRKDEYLSIKVDKELVKSDISQLQNSLIGRLTLAQGDKPYDLDDLKCKLG